MLETTLFDPADYLDDEQAIALYMTEALESGDKSFIVDAFGVVARARKRLGNEHAVDAHAPPVPSFADGEPAFNDVMRAVQGLGLRLVLQPAANQD